MIFKEKQFALFKSILFFIIMFIAVVFSTSPTLAQTVFPGATWQTKTPEEVGMNSTALLNMSNYIGGRGFVSRNGYQVYTWGSYTGRGDIASAAKPFYSTFLFKAVEDGLLPSLDTKANIYEPCLNNINASLGYKDRNITFRHFANQISGYQVSEAPGTAYDYNDWQMALFWDTLFLKVYGTTYANVDSTVLQPKLANILQMEDNPTFMAFGTGNRPGRVGISPRDFARFGLLFLNQGNWNGTQVISKNNAIMAVTNPLPNSIPRTTGQLAQTCPNQRTMGSTAVPDNQGDHAGSYSWLWWTNGVDRNGIRHWPDGPYDTYGAFGHGGPRVMVVIPSLELIISWNDSQVNTSAEQNEALKRLVAAVTDQKPQAGQVMVDPYNPSWLVYNRDNNGDSKFDPYFLAGPGDPEDFLYRGTQNPDGTRTGDQITLINKLKGTGANSIYMQAVRSHGGDGNATHNPFINNDPAQGISDTKLNQWEQWFTEMDSNGITIFFFFYDDSACIWNCDKTIDHTVPSQEQAMIQALVDKFEHHKNLIWIVAEEYSEKFSAARASVIAQAIKQADDYNHVVAVHQHSGLSFNFATDSNIDQFAMQYNPQTVTPDVLHSGMVTAWNNAAGRYNLNMSEVAGGRIGTGATARKNAWGVVMGGAYVMIHGMDIAGTALSDLQDMGNIVSFFESTDFNTMAPHDELKFGQTKYVLANPGVSYIAYADNATNNLGILTLPASTYNLVWFDTVTGNKVTQSAVSASGDTTFTKPSGIGSEVALYVQNTQGGTLPSLSPTPTPVQTLTPTPTGPTPTPVSGLITDLTVTSGKTYALNLLKTGEKVYIDREFTFTTIPANLIDQVYIKTANTGDKGDTSSSFLTFSATSDVAVYVGYDMRASQLPAWLSDGTWTNTGMVLAGSDTNFNLFQKDFTDGSQVVLGGNLQSPAQGAGSMYTVVVVPQQTSLTPTPVPGDTNNDQQVDSIDVNNIITNFNSNTYIEGDFNQSGIVNILDLSILLSNFGP